MRITKQILECKCDWIRRETGLNIGISYEYNSQKLVLNGVHEEGFTGCMNISCYGTKTELGNTLDAIYSFVSAMKYVGTEYRLDEPKYKKMGKFTGV